MSGGAVPLSRRLATLATVALLALGLAACRTARVQTEPGPVYMVDVTNRLQQPIVVQFDDGGGARLLGTVAAGGVERFVIAAPRQLQVTIIGATRDRAREVRRDVTLQPGVAIPVIIS